MRLPALPFAVIIVGISLSLSFISPAAAAPTSIVYQGSLKQNGTPVNGTYPMVFNITNADGSQVYWTSGSTPTVIKEGLYRIELTPTNVSWETIDPYIETRVNGAVLLPREKVSSAPYALIAKDLSPGATAKGDLYVMGGNLGIGTTHPMEALDVNGGSNFRDNFSIPADFQIGVRYRGASFRFYNDGTTHYADVYSDWRPAFDNTYYLGNAGRRWISVYAANGVIQTSSSRLKKEIRELAFNPDGSTAINVVPNSAISMSPSLKLQTVKGSDGKEEEIVTPNLSNPRQVRVPRAILFKWKNPASAKEDQDMLGFMGDDLPLEAHAIRSDGTRDPNSFYTSAVVGILCAKVRALDTKNESQEKVISTQAAQIVDLTARVAALESKR